MKYITLQIEKGIAELILMRPELKNAFHAEMIAELDQAWQLIAQDKTIKALMISGSGHFFCAGADLNWMASVADGPVTENVEDARRFDRMLSRLRDLPIPKCAWVQGGAFGGGLGILACCNAVWATKPSRFSFSEIRLGLAPAVIAPYVTEAIGARWARYYFLTGVLFDAEEASERGLVHHVVSDPVSLDVERERMITHFRSTSDVALQACYALPEWRADQTVPCMASLRASAEARAQIKHFLKKEK